jgi:hypothetical protein
MKNLLKLEELALFALATYCFHFTGLGYGWFAGQLLLPDLGMLGYLHGPRLGAFSYNLLHHRGLGVAAAFAGLLLGSQWALAAGVLLLAHASMDRMLGYGLKFPDSFSNTHLGPIGQTTLMQRKAS